MRATERSRGRVLSLLAGVFLAIAWPSPAHAAGLYFSQRGVRPLGRGGAFVARADDLGAIWYNPAGVFESGNQFLIDASILNFSTEFTRKAILEQRDPNTNQVVATYEQTFDAVEGSSAPVPIPTLAVSYKLHPEWVLAIGAMAPYSAITSYPEEVNGVPAGSRYSLITLQGSALVVPGVWAAWGPIDEIRVGVGFEMLVGTFVATSMFNACLPERFFCAPEQPDWDSLTELRAGPIIAPSANLGILVLPHDMVRLGAAVQLPFWVRSPAKVRSRLPSTPVFETAYQEGEDARVRFELPWHVRAGIEVNPYDKLMIELDGEIEGWQMHDAITVKPELALRNVVGFPDPFILPEKRIERHFRNAYAVRLGGEWDIDVGGEFSVIPRLGVGYESSAIAPEYVSALAVDINKVSTSLGFGVGYASWRFDLVGAFVFGPGVEVAPQDAKIPINNPVEANVSQPHTINGGSYTARAIVFGIGLKYNFDEVAPAFGAPEATEKQVPAKRKPDKDEGDDASDGEEEGEPDPEEGEPEREENGA